MTDSKVTDDVDYLEDHRRWSEALADCELTLAVYDAQIEVHSADIAELEASLPSLGDGTIEGAGAVRAAKIRLAGLEHTLFGTELAHKALEEEIARLEASLAEIKAEVDRINGVPGKALGIKVS
jgi:hypothetical protein